MEQIQPNSFKYVQLAGLCALLYALALRAFIDLPGITGSSEAREALVASVVLRDGEWILPRRNGLVPSKPPLYHWITALIAQSMDSSVTPAVSRLTSLLSAAGVLFLASLCVMKLVAGFARYSQGKVLAIGALCAFVLATTYAFTILAVQGMVDMTFTFFVTLGVFALVSRCGASDPVLRGESGTALRSVDFSLFYLSSAFAVLAKGPLGLVLPLCLAGSALSYRFGWRAAVSLFIRPRIGWMIFILGALPWYLLAWLQGSGEFFERQWFFENVRRLTGGEAIRSEPFWFYVPQFLRFAAPWSLVLVGTLVAWVRRPGEYPSPFAEERRIKNLALVLFAAGFLLFSLPSGKRHSYLLPLYPWLSIYLAWHCVDLYDAASTNVQTWISRQGANLAAYVGLLWLVLLLLIEVCREPLFSRHPAAANMSKLFLQESAKIEWQALIFMVASFAAYKLLVRTCWPRRLSSGLSIVLCFVLLTQLSLAVRSSSQGWGKFSAQVAQKVGPTEPLFVVRDLRDEFFDPFLYYVGRSAVLLDPKNMIYPARGFVLARREWLEMNCGDLAAQGPWREVAQWQRGTATRSSNESGGAVVVQLGLALGR